MVYCRKGHFFLLLYGGLLAAWLSSYMYSIFEMQVLGFASQVFLVFLSIVVLYKKDSILLFLGKKILFFLIATNFFILLFSLKEVETPWFLILTVKNVLYVNASIVIGVAIADLATRRTGGFEYVVKAATYTLMSFGVFFAYMLLVGGYVIGGDLLGTDFAETYQGVSRFFGLIALSAAMTSSVFVSVPAMLVAIYVSFACQSYGVFAFLFACLLVFLVKGNLKKSIGVKTILVFAFLIFFLYIFYQAFLVDADFSVGFLNRLEGKLEPAEGEGRLGLFLAAMSYIVEDAASFLIGPSFYDYSCALNRCDYRHTHNIFLNLWFYFGVFSLFFSGLLVFIVKISIAQFVSGKYVYCAMLFMVFFVVASFGGDIEQNRNLFLFASAVYCIDKVVRRRESCKRCVEKPLFLRTRRS